jgi:hypothetical protein
MVVNHLNLNGAFLTTTTFPIIKEHTSAEKDKIRIHCSKMNPQPDENELMAIQGLLNLLHVK